MGSVGKRFKKIPEKLYAKFGNTAEVVEVVQGVWDTDLGEAPLVKTPTTLRCGIEEYTVNDIASGVVQVGDMRVIVPARDFNIDKEWRVNYDGKEWLIINFGKLEVDDEIIYYYLQVRTTT